MCHATAASYIDIAKQYNHLVLVLDIDIVIDIAIDIALKIAFFGLFPALDESLDGAKWP